MATNKRKNNDKKEVTVKLAYDELKENYKFVSEQIKIAKEDILINGQTILSKSNGLVRNPSVIILDTLLKQLKAITSDIIILEKEVESSKSGNAKY